MTAKIVSRLAFAGMRSFAPQVSTSIGRSGSAQAEGVDAFRSSKITGAKSGVGAPNAKACSRAAFRQAKTWLGATLCRRAIAETTAPSSSASATIVSARCFNLLMEI